MLASTRTTLSTLVEEHLTELISSAKSIQRHTKRVKTQEKATTPTDNQPLKKVLDAEDINLALQLRGQERIYAPNPTISTSNSVDDQVIDFIEKKPSTGSKRVDLNAYVSSEMQSQPPFEIGLRFHWLAVDGVQPSIPQNPLRVMQLETGNEEMVHRIEDEDNTSLVVSTPNAIAQQTNQDISSSVTIRQLLPRLLSEELQFYFTRITLAISHSDASQQDSALSSIQNDAGIQELIPFFSRFVTTQILNNVSNVEYCRLLIRFCDAMLDNPHVHLELHLHQIMPAVISCIVGKSVDDESDHWILREEAARTLLKACVMFGAQYTTLKSRILKTFVQAIDIRTKPSSTIYGGIIGITVFGPKAIDAFLIPIASFYYKVWEHMLLEETDAIAILQIEYCQYAMLNAVGIFLQHGSLVERRDSVNLEEFKDVFGEKLIPFYRGLGECDVVLL